jgi:hypothetical protein
LFAQFSAPSGCITYLPLSRWVLLNRGTQVIDTAVLFPHPRGPPFKPALRVLCERFLHRKIQQVRG